MHFRPLFFSNSTVTEKKNPLPSIASENTVDPFLPNLVDCIYFHVKKLTCFKSDHENPVR